MLTVWLLEWAVTLRGLSRTLSDHCGQEREDSACKVKDRQDSMDRGWQEGFSPRDAHSCFFKIPPRKSDSVHTTKISFWLKILILSA